MWRPLRTGAVAAACTALFLVPGRAGAAAMTAAPASGSPLSAANPVREYSSTIDYHGQLHVFYITTVNHLGTTPTVSLRHSWWNGPSWSTETIDGEGTSWTGHGQVTVPYRAASG